MVAQNTSYRFDPADQLDIKERIEKLRGVDPELVEAMLDPGAYRPGGRLSVSALGRITGRSTSQVHRDFKRLLREARA